MLFKKEVVSLSRPSTTCMNDTTPPVAVQPFTVTLSLDGLELRLTLSESLDLRLNDQGEYTCTHVGFDTLEPPVLQQLQSFALVLEDLLGWREWLLHPEEHYPTFYPSAVYGQADPVATQDFE